MSELEVREEPAGRPPGVQPRPMLTLGGLIGMGVIMFLPPSALGTTIMAGGVALLLRVSYADIPRMLEQDKVRPEVVAVGSVAATLYMFDVVVDNALLPLSLDVIAQPMMAVAMGALAVLTAAIPAFAVSVWRFWQREMM